MSNYLFWAILACSADKVNEGDDSGSEFERPDEQNGQGDGGDGDGSGLNLPSSYNGNILGSIDIQLFEISESGDRETVLWADAYGGVFPFGKIFVAAYYENNDGYYVYVGHDIVENPQPTGNQYNIEVTAPADQPIRVFGLLDYYVDDITGTDEPVGGYNRTIVFEEEGETVDNVNFSILSPLHEEREPCENDRTVNITGDVTITTNYTGGDVAVVLMKPGNIGPVHHAYAVPEVQGGGAVAEYALEACENSGDMILKGIWDSNLNGMYDPIDRYGPYVSEPNQSGNPIGVGYSDLADYEIQIPMEDGSGLKLVPFVKLFGSVRTANGNFEELASTASLYVAALKYRPQGELTIQDLEENSYDFEYFSPEELQGLSSVDWRLTVPSETIAYIWAYIDLDGDGTVNGPGEPIASGGEDFAGKFPTGSQTTENIDMVLATME
ncbi:MAG: hypothetical protein VX278_02280 [Myxococcota bacterium]|nr:hypothetical protein [Myxococcota bacterium]